MYILIIDMYLLYKIVKCWFWISVFSSREKSTSGLTLQGLWSPNWIWCFLLLLSMSNVGFFFQFYFFFYPIHAIFFIQSSDTKFGPYEVCFHNGINQIGHFQTTNLWYFNSQLKWLQIIGKSKMVIAKCLVLVTYSCRRC